MRICPHDRANGPCLGRAGDLTLQRMPRNECERARVEEDERPAHQPAPRPPEPQLLRLQRSAGNAAVTRLLQRDTLRMRPPDLKAGDSGYDAAMRAVDRWFDPVAAEVRQREAGSPVQSVAELVWIACELAYTDDAGQPAKVRDHIKPGALEDYLRRRAKHQGIELLEHRGMADVRGVQAEAMAILGNLGRIPTEATFGGDDNHITISLTGTVTAEAKVGAVKFEGEGSPGGVSGKASVKGNVGELEAHGSGEGVGASLKTPGGTKIGVDIGKGAKAELKAGDFVTVKGSVQPEGDGKVSWSAQITIGTLGDVITPADVAKVMNGAQETFSKSGAALMRDRGLEGLVEHGGPLKSAVTDVAAKARKSAGQGKPGWSVGVGVKGDKSGGYSGTVTLTWVF